MEEKNFGWERIIISEYEGHYEGMSGFSDLVPDEDSKFSKKYLRVRAGISKVKPQSGIYIMHFMNGWYVGQSKDVRKRLHSHNSSAWSGANQGIDQMLQLLYTEYKEEGLDIRVFYCDEDYMNFWEVYFIAFLRYNHQTMHNATDGGDNKTQKLRVPPQFTQGMLDYVDFYKAYLIEEEVFDWAVEYMDYLKNNRVNYAMMKEERNAKVYI